MYLGRIDMIMLDMKLADESFPISEQRSTLGEVLDGMECQILLGTRASKSFVSIHII